MTLDRSTSFLKPPQIGGFEDVATIELTIGGIAIHAITLDQVIASKEKLDRPKDRAALPALYAAREELGRRLSEK